MCRCDHTYQDRLLRRGSGWRAESLLPSELLGPRDQSEDTGDAYDCTKRAVTRYDEQKEREKGDEEKAGSVCYCACPNERDFWCCCEELKFEGQSVGPKGGGPSNCCWSGDIVLQQPKKKLCSRIQNVTLPGISFHAARFLCLSLSLSLSNHTLALRYTDSAS